MTGSVKHSPRESRNMDVLAYIIREYTHTALPVSSRAVSSRMGQRLSSATIRNIMAQLEDRGYIAQPHTSAGRVPTARGYRQFVDLMKGRMTMERKEAHRLQKEYDERARDIQELLRRTTMLISRELKNASLVMWPSLGDLYLRRLELIKVNAETALAVLVTMTNAVRNHVIRLDRDLALVELAAVSNYINTHFGDRPLTEVYRELKENPAGEHRGNDVMKIASRALSVIDSIISSSMEDADVYWEGLDNFMNEPESRDLSLIGRVLRIFSDRKRLLSILEEDKKVEGVSVHIGGEGECADLDGISIVTSGYSIHGRSAGRIGVVGPSRMDYGHALRTLSCLSGLITSKIEEMDH